MKDKEFENIKKYLEALSEKGPPYPLEIFFLLNRLAPAVSVEAIIVNESGKIFLTLRPADDPFYANMWHFPGTILLGKETMEDGIQRIQSKEVRQILLEPERTTRMFTHHGEDTEGKSPRGCVEHVLYLFLTNKDTVPGGEFFDLGSLPEATVGHHRKILQVLSVEWGDVFHV